LIAEAESLPFGAAVEMLHKHFRRLVQAGFFIEDEPWLHVSELASISKLVYLHGHGRQQWLSFDLSVAMNAYKRIWELAEAEAPYASNSEQVACFALRFVYQQVPFNIDSQKMNQNFQRTLVLFNGRSNHGTKLREAFEQASGTSVDTFLKIAHLIGTLFEGSSHFPRYALENKLENHFSPQDVAKAISLLCASRGQLRKYYEKYRASTPWQIPYEFNPLLRFPVLIHSDQYWCVYPELINYAATRGLYFYLSDVVANDFAADFSKAFEQYVAQLCIDKFGLENVLTEDDERRLGWKKKTNDITVLLGDSALLFECKNSGLFGLAKRSADPQEVASDARKNLVNPEKRKGLYQLYDKIASIRAAELPRGLAERFAAVKYFYPVVLLHDQISFANKPECLKNIIDADLRTNAIFDFNYQIWHIEELENLVDLIAREKILGTIEEKFKEKEFRTMDLSVYLAKKTGLARLNPPLFLPRGETQAWQTLRCLVEQEQARKQ
jgi:hypothetical protein